MIALHSDAGRDRYVAFLKAQPLPLAVECKPWKPSRTDRQNAYLWRAVYQPLVEVAGFTKERWHEYFCGQRWGWVEVELPGGRSESRPARTTTTGFDGKRNVLPPDEFDAFVTYLESELAAYGVFVEERPEDA